MRFHGGRWAVGGGMARECHVGVAVGPLRQRAAIGSNRGGDCDCGCSRVVVRVVARCVWGVFEVCLRGWKGFGGLG